jgi:hypothetical protein
MLTNQLLKYVPLWLPFAVVLATQLITLFFLHEREQHSLRWWARNIVIVLGIAGAAVAYSFQVRSQEVAQLMRDQVNLTSASVAREESNIRMEQHQLDLQHTKIAALLVDTHATSQSMLDAQRRIARQQSNVARLRSTTEALRERSTSALAHSLYALKEARNVQGSVSKAIAESSARLSSAERAAQESAREAQVARAQALEAASRAGVYHFAADVRQRVTALLRSAAPSATDIACSPGLESACSDLRDMFAAANWKPIMAYGASFYGGFDIQVPDPTAGIIVWYLPQRQKLASDLARIFAAAGLDATIQQSLNTTTSTEIGISLRFITK